MNKSINHVPFVQRGYRRAFVYNDFSVTDNSHHQLVAERACLAKGVAVAIMHHVKTTVHIHAHCLFLFLLYFPPPSQSQSLRRYAIFGYAKVQPHSHSHRYRSTYQIGRRYPGHCQILPIPQTKYNTLYMSDVSAPIPTYRFVFAFFTCSIWCFLSLGFSLGIRMVNHGCSLQLMPLLFGVIERKYFFKRKENIIYSYV